MYFNYLFKQIIIFIAVFFILYGSGNMAMGEESGMPTENIRKSVIAGTWYPGNETELRNTIQSFLDRVPEKSAPGKIIAIISPHAGYIYSGQVAAHSYKLLEKEKFDTVIIISPSHHAYFEGVSVYDQGGYQTPLGIVPLDTELISMLKQSDSRIRYVPEAHSKEHSLEIQLPFLQVVMPKFKLVPLIMGEQNLSTCQWLAQLLADNVKDKSVLIVASSDLSHFHTYKDAKALDNLVLESIKKFDPQGLSENISSGKCEACGGGPMITAMIAARLLGATKSEVLNYANSGDVTGDHSRVVGYVSAALWDNPGKKENKDKPEKGDKDKKAGIDMGLTAEEKSLLHQIVRETIQAKLDRKEPKIYESSSSTLKEPRGAFVTLKKHGELRGCIGHIIASYPLIETISQMAVAAAFEDPRFPPVSSDELKDLEIEISVLTPLRKITDVKKIEVGKHGIYIKKGFYSGILLPQVATEYGWDRDTFLEHTCMKAGLPQNAWKDKDTEIFIYSADIF